MARVTRRAWFLVFAVLAMVGAMVGTSPLHAQELEPAADIYDAIWQDLIDFGENLRQTEATLADMSAGDRFFLEHMDMGRQKLLLLAPLAGSLDAAMDSAMDQSQSDCRQALGPTLEVLAAQIENESFQVSEIVNANDQVRPEIVELVARFQEIAADLAQAVHRTQGRMYLE